MENDDNTNGSSVADVSVAATITELLGVNVNDFLLSMTTSTVAARGEVICRFEIPFFLK